MNWHGPVLLYDNSQPDLAKLTLQKVEELGYETLPHPQSSLDLVLTDYYFFMHLSILFNGKTFRFKEKVKLIFKNIEHLI